MDNARRYYDDIITTYSMEQNLNLIFLSPYIYMLNPIEFTFSKIKAIFRGQLSLGYTGYFKNQLREVLIL